MIFHSHDEAEGEEHDSERNDIIDDTGEDLNKLNTLLVDTKKVH